MENKTHNMKCWKCSKDFQITQEEIDAAYADMPQEEYPGPIAFPCPECKPIIKREREAHVQSLIAEYGTCPKCGEHMENDGAHSDGDGDIYDLISCSEPYCEYSYKRHASYCTCPDCI